MFFPSSGSVMFLYQHVAAKKQVWPHNYCKTFHNLKKNGHWLHSEQPLDRNITYNYSSNLFLLCPGNSLVFCHHYNFRLSHFLLYRRNSQNSSFVLCLARRLHRKTIITGSGRGSSLVTTLRTRARCSSSVHPYLNEVHFSGPLNFVILLTSLEASWFILVN